MNTQRLLLDSYLKTLKLPTMRAEYKAIARRCSEADAAYEDYLEQLAELEVQRRTAMAIERRLKQAEFPMVKEMSSYRFADVPKLNKKYVMDLARCQFIETRQERTVLKLEKNIRKCNLIIIDELGYIPLDRMGAEHLFGFFSQCYEQTSLNKGKEKQG
ncbi:MAG: ATP-binding protein [Planctomycetes bacterium]|nr:ATP-binding protein [Planctomycetota bacterium]